MIEIKNHSTEDFEIVTHIDGATPGCRLDPRGPLPQPLSAGQSVTLIGYEPGALLRIRPVVKPEWARPLDVEQRPWP